MTLLFSQKWPFWVILMIFLGGTLSIFVRNCQRPEGNRSNEVETSIPDHSVGGKAELDAGLKKLRDDVGKGMPVDFGDGSIGLAPVYLVKKWFRETDDASEIANWLDEHHSSIDTHEACIAFANDWLPFDPASAVAWITTLPQGETRDEVLKNSIFRLCALNDGGFELAYQLAVLPDASGSNTERLERFLVSSHRFRESRRFCGMQSHCGFAAFGGGTKAGRLKATLAGTLEPI